MVKQAMYSFPTTQVMDEICLPYCNIYYPSLLGMVFVEPCISSLACCILRVLPGLFASHQNAAEAKPKPIMFQSGKTTFIKGGNVAPNPATNSPASPALAATKTPGNLKHALANVVQYPTHHFEHTVILVMTNCTGNDYFVIVLLCTGNNEKETGNPKAEAGAAQETD